MSSEEAQEEPAKVQEGGEPDPLTVVLDRLETINLTLFQIDQRLQEVEKPPPPRGDSKELDSRRNSHDNVQGACKASRLTKKKISSLHT